MFYFLCKSIHCHGRLGVRASRAQYELPFLQNLVWSSLLFSSKCSSEDATNRHSFTVSYLINSCGLSLESALSASKHVHFETPDKPNSVLDFFQNRGFSKFQISILIKKYPKVLLSRPEKTLSPKLGFFYSKGISRGDLAEMLSLYPSLLHGSLKNQIVPKFDYLCNLFQSSEKTISLIKNFPPILYDRAENDVGPRVKILQDIGVPESNITKFVYTWPLSMVCPNQKYFEKRVAAVKEMGISPLKSQFVAAIKAQCYMSESLWESKLDVYKKWGWSEEEWLAAFAKYPWCMIMSMDKITEAMDFFINKMGWKSSVLAKHPILINFSLEKRVIPRVAVIHFLLSKGLIKESTNFISSFRYSEEIFLQRFVNCYDEAPLLLKLYQEKLNLSNKTNCSS